jgi:hypothetical protein
MSSIRMLGPPLFDIVAFQRAPFPDTRVTYLMRRLTGAAMRRIC